MICCPSQKMLSSGLDRQSLKQNFALSVGRYVIKMIFVGIECKYKNAGNFQKQST